MSDWPFGDLKPATYRAAIIDFPWKFAAGTKGRPQHYDRLTFDQICALPIKSLLHPDGARVFLWITAPLLNRISDLAKAFGLRYSTTLPWIKLWPNEGGMFIFADSFARGMGLEVVGNAEYLVILKYRKPQSIKGNPFPSMIVASRRAHSRKPPNLHEEIEARLDPPFCELYARESRPGWSSFGNESSKFDRKPSSNSLGIDIRSSILTT